MNEADLKDRLRDLTADQPPLRRDTADILRRGRRRVFARRAGVAAGAGVLVVATGIGATAWWPVDSGRTTEATRTNDAAVAGSPEGGLVQRCTQVDNGALDPAVFGPGSRIVVSDAAGPLTQLVIVSTDGDSWASCWLTDDPGAEFNGYAQTFPMDVASGGQGDQNTTETAGYGYGHGAFYYADRFPAEVAEVELRFRGGPTITRPTVDGFVVAVAEAPEFTMDGSVYVLWTLRDADGNVLGRTGGWPGLGPELSLPRRYQTLVPAG